MRDRTRRGLVCTVLLTALLGATPLAVSATQSWIGSGSSILADGGIMGSDSRDGVIGSGTRTQASGGFSVGGNRSEEDLSGQLGSGALAEGDGPAFGSGVGDGGGMSSSGG